LNTFTTTQPHEYHGAESVNRARPDPSALEVWFQLSESLPTTTVVRIQELQILWILDALICDVPICAGAETHVVGGNQWDMR
jgi:hypothetical protein